MAQNPEKKSEQGGEKAESPLDKAKEAVRENLLKRRDELIAEVEETFQQKISAGSGKLDERALAKIVSIKNEQINEVASFFNEEIKKFNELGAERASETDKIATEMMNTATERAKKRIGKLKGILDAKVKETYLTTAEVGEIESAVVAMREFEKKHPEAEETFEKLANKGELVKKDYEQIVAMIQPLSVKDSTAGMKFFEATTAGLFISMMRQDQRYELVRVFMDSEKRDATGDFIEAMLSAGKLNKMQGEKLIQEAKAKGLAISAEWEANFKKTDYEAEAKKYQAALESEARTKYGGRFAENIANRFSGKPFFYLLAVCWGTITLGMNILVNRKKGDKIGDVLGRLAKNPYVWASGAAIGGGIEGMFGSLKVGRTKTGSLLSDWGMGAGPISRGVESWSEKGDEEKLKERARAEMERLYTNAPDEFRAYLDNGGFTTMQTVRAEILEKDLPKKITIDQLLEKETDAAQKTRLTAMKSLTFTTETGISERFTTFSEAAFVMGIATNDDLKPELKVFREKQEPTANA